MGPGVLNVGVPRGGAARSGAPCVPTLVESFGQVGIVRVLVKLFVAAGSTHRPASVATHRVCAPRTTRAQQRPPAAPFIPRSPRLSLGGGDTGGSGGGFGVWGAAAGGGARTAVGPAKEGEVHAERALGGQVIAWADDRLGLGIAGEPGKDDRDGKRAVLHLQPDTEQRVMFKKEVGREPAACEAAQGQAAAAACSSRPGRATPHTRTEQSGLGPSSWRGRCPGSRSWRTLRWRSR